MFSTQLCSYRLELGQPPFSDMGLLPQVFFFEFPAASLLQRFFGVCIWATFRVCSFLDFTSARVHEVIRSGSHSFPATRLLAFHFFSGSAST